MPIAYLRPSAQGDYGTWSLGAGASKLAAVTPGGATYEDAVTHDDDTTYVQIPATTTTAESMACNGSRPPMAEVVSMTAKVRARLSQVVADAVIFDVFHRLNGVDGTHATVGTTGGYFEHSATARPGGGSWTPSDFEAGDDIEVGWNVSDWTTTNPGTRDMLATSAWAEVDFLPPPGAFAWMIFQWLGATAAVQLAEMPGLATEIWRRSRGSLLIRPEEYLAAWRELRKGRYVRLFDPNVSVGGFVR